MNEIANNLLQEKSKANFISTRKKRQNKLFLKIKRQPDTPPHYNLYKKNITNTHTPGPLNLFLKSMNLCRFSRG